MRKFLLFFWILSMENLSFAQEENQHHWEWLDEEELLEMNLTEED